MKIILLICIFFNTVGAIRNVIQGFMTSNDGSMALGLVEMLIVGILVVCYAQEVEK